MVYKFLLIIFLCKKLFKGQKKQNFTLLSSCRQIPVKYAIFALQINLSSDKSLRFILILFFIKVKVTCRIVIKAGFGNKNKKF